MPQRVWKRKEKQTQSKKGENNKIKAETKKIEIIIIIQKINEPKGWFSKKINKVDKAYWYDQEKKEGTHKLSKSAMKERTSKHTIYKKPTVNLILHVAIWMFSPYDLELGKDISSHISIQYCTGGSSQSNKRRKRN